jgi:hypothetical protein
MPRCCSAQEEDNKWPFLFQASLCDAQDEGDCGEWTQSADRRPGCAVRHASLLAIRRRIGGKQWRLPTSSLGMVRSIQTKEIWAFDGFSAFLYLLRDE